MGHAAIVICSIYECFLYHFKFIDGDTFSFNDLLFGMDTYWDQLSAMYEYGVHPRTLIIALIEDFEFYVYHRACHQVDYLWKNVHKIHHQSYNPNVFSGLSFHWIEGILYFLPFLMFIVCPIPSIVFAVFKLGLIWGPIPNHTGYGVKSEPNISWCIFMIRKGSYYHYIHHATNKYNFGSGVTPIWDKLMGTEYHLSPKQHFDRINKMKQKQSH